MRLRDFKIIKLASEGAMSHGGKKLCSDGLILDETKSERKERIRLAKLAVKHEQELQWNGCVNDPEAISSVYYDHSCYAANIALKRGLTVAKEVAEASRLRKGQIVVIKGQPRVRKVVVKTVRHTGGPTIPQCRHVS